MCIRDSHSTVRWEDFVLDPTSGWISLLRNYATAQESAQASCISGQCTDHYITGISDFAWWTIDPMQSKCVRSNSCACCAASSAWHHLSLTVTSNARNVNETVLFLRVYMTRVFWQLATDKWHFLVGAASHWWAGATVPPHRPNTPAYQQLDQILPSVYQQYADDRSIDFR